MSDDTKLMTWHKDVWRFQTNDQNVAAKKNWYGKKLLAQYKQPAKWYAPLKTVRPGSISGRAIPKTWKTGLRALFSAFMDGHKETVPLAHHQRSNHYESSRVAHSASKRRWAPADHSLHFKQCTRTEYKRNWIEMMVSPQRVDILVYFGTVLWVEYFHLFCLYMYFSDFLL